MTTISNFSLNINANYSGGKPGNFSRDGNYVTSEGKTGTVQTQVSSGNGHLTRDQTGATQDGITYSREVNSSYDKATGSFSRSVTGANGVGVTGEMGTDGTYVGAYTTASGKAGTFSGSAARNEDGSVANSSSITTENGGTLDRSTTSSYDKEAGSLTRTISGLGGNTHTISIDVKA